MAGTNGNKRRLFSYSEEALNNAINAVELEGMSKREASRVYNVPRTTLRDKVANRVPRERRMGPRPYLTQLEEIDIVQ